MELTLAHLDLPNATSQIPDYGQGLDPYQAIQLHDYQSVSFFRQPAEIKASSTKIIDLFQRYYPETVSYKYFANVPLLMQWMMGAMKALMSKDSIQKMTWTSYGNTLDQYLGKDVPKEYGGNGPALEGSAWTVKYDEAAPTATEKVEPTKTAEPPAQPQSSTTAPEATTATVAEPEPSSTVSASEPSEAVPVASSAPEVTKS
jgi:hypothetical protein